MRFIQLSLSRQITIAMLTTGIIVSTVAGYIAELDTSSKLGLILICTLVSGGLGYQLTRHIAHGMRAIQIGLQNFCDGEFSVTLTSKGKDELSELSALYNQAATRLREEKQWLHQRELMLDKVLQGTPDVVMLVNDRDVVVFSNIEARHFFSASSRLEGAKLSALVEALPTPLKSALSNRQNGLYTVTSPLSESQTWHISNSRILLNNQQHQLFVIKQLTRELSRQEVAVWKKVIRVISHELNNSIAPISSLIHSGKLVSANFDDNRLDRVFTTIEGRIDHLNQFVQGYGKFAKLPAPSPARIDWQTLIAELNAQWSFNAQIASDIELYADPVQLEQLLINLLKNAHESGSDTKDINLSVCANQCEVQIQVSDQGSGMTEAVMASALVPFYSTKGNGTGLGLALCREIAEAHHGHIYLSNNDKGGLTVTVNLPAHHHHSFP